MTICPKCHKEIEEEHYIIIFEGKLRYEKYFCKDCHDKVFDELMKVWSHWTTYSEIGVTENPY